VTILESSVLVLRHAEKLVIGKKINCSWSFGADVLDTLLHGPWFVMAGFEALALMILRSAMASLGIGIVLFLITFVQENQISSWTPFVLAATTFGLGTVLFGLPSGVGVRGVEEAHVTELAAEIVKQASSAASVKLVREGVEKIELVGQRHISAARWVLGLAWALLVWVTANWVLDPSVSNEVRNGAVSYAFVVLFLFLGFGATVACYQMAKNQLHQTLLFAFLEAEHDCTNNERGQPT